LRDEARAGRQQCGAKPPESFGWYWRPAAGLRSASPSVGALLVVDGISKSHREEVDNMELKLEVVVLPVSDVDKAKQFYKGLGFREDIDYAAPDGYRVVQLTPPGSACSIIFGKGVTTAKPGSVDRLALVVSDIEAARDELRSHGVEVSMFHDADGGQGAGFYADMKKRAPGPDPQRRTYASYASFSDPDGNVWLLQEIKERLPGRV
jgi:catechol 2,3-dioxygenase-like lactoylglutathione lyase family enzyme